MTYQSFLKRVPWSFYAVNFGSSLTLSPFLVGKINWMQCCINPLNDALIFDCNLYQTEMRYLPSLIWSCRNQKAMDTLQKMLLVPKEKQLCTIYFRLKEYSQKAIPAVTRHSLRMVNIISVNAPTFLQTSYLYLTQANEARQELWPTLYSCRDDFSLQRKRKRGVARHEQVMCSAHLKLPRAFGK